MDQIIASKSKSFLISCFAFLLGITIASLAELHISIFVALFLAIGFGGLIGIFWTSKTIRFFLLLLLLVSIGMVRYSLAFPQSESHVVEFAERNITLVGHVAAEPDDRLDAVRYIVSADEIDGGQSITGRVYLKAPRHPRYYYGDRLKITCKIRKPEPFEDFRYDMYLAKFRVFATCQNSMIEKIGEGEGNRFMASILSVKQIVADRIAILWHEPHASFMAGLLYGYRGGLGSLNEQFSRTGVTHIVAISGYNITIISSILIALCVSVLIPRKKAFWLITLGIIVFVLFAGASASVVRAGIMGIIVLLAKQLGRLSRVGNVMVLTAVIMSLMNPFVLIWDAGFQLSFLSTLGLVYIAPLMEPLFTKVPTVLGIQESLISTLASIVSTLPLILYQFGRLSIVAPMVNMLILWIIPMIMAIGFFSVVSSFVFSPMAQLLAWFSYTLMLYITKTVEWFSMLSFAAVDVQMPLWFLVGGYVAMVYWIRRSLKLGTRN